jgi:hypothetical protein
MSQRNLYHTEYRILGVVRIYLSYKFHKRICRTVLVLAIKWNANLSDWVIMKVFLNTITVVCHCVCKVAIWDTQICSVYRLALLVAEWKLVTYFEMSPPEHWMNFLSLFRNIVFDEVITRRKPIPFVIHAFKRSGPMFANYAWWRDTFELRLPSYWMWRWACYIYADVSEGPASYIFRLRIYQNTRRHIPQE